MTLAVDYYLDQPRCDQQDEISLDLYIQGFTDGYEGREKSNSEEEYKTGYEKGLSTWIKEEITIPVIIDNYLPF